MRRGPSRYAATDGCDAAAHSGELGVGAEAPGLEFLEGVQRLEHRNVGERQRAADENLPSHAASPACRKPASFGLSLCAGS